MPEDSCCEGPIRGGWIDLVLNCDKSSYTKRWSASKEPRKNLSRLEEGASLDKNNTVYLASKAPVHTAYNKYSKKLKNVDKNMQIGHMSLK